MQAGLIVTQKKCRRCEHQWVESVPLLRTGSNSFRYSEQTTLPPVILHTHTEEQAYCHNCIDPALPSDWPPWTGPPEEQIPSRIKSKTTKRALSDEDLDKLLGD